jgi:hypothetical protein
MSKEQPIDKHQHKVSDEVRSANKRLAIILGLLVIGIYAGFIIISNYIR